jgi:hypothetical protein
MYRQKKRDRQVGEVLRDAVAATWSAMSQSPRSSPVASIQAPLSR